MVPSRHVGGSPRSVAETEVLGVKAGAEIRREISATPRRAVKNLAAASGDAGRRATAATGPPADGGGPCRHPA